MFLTTIVVTLILVVLLLLSAVGKMLRLKPVRENLARAGVRVDQFLPLAALETTGAVGLVIGLW